MKLRAAGDAGDNWWNALEEKYGKGEALLINGIIMKYLDQQEFPTGGVEERKNPARRERISTANGWF